MKPWMKPSLRLDRVLLGVTVGLFVSLVITKVRIMQLEDLAKTRELLAKADDLTDMSLSAQLRRMTDVQRDGHVKNLCAIADAITSKRGQVS